MNYAVLILCRALIFMGLCIRHSRISALYLSMCIRHFILVVILTLPLALWASPKSSENVAKATHHEAVLDSIHNAKNSDATIRFYEKLKKRSEKKRFTRWLYRAFFVSPNKDTLTDLNVVDESKLFKQYNGKRIANIYTHRGQVFNDGGNFLERLANNTHFLTRDKVVRRDLLLHEGDTVDADLVMRNKYLLRSRSYIYDADIRFKQSKIDSSLVDMYIYTRDNWSLSADFESSVKGNSSLEIYDANILGFGNKLNLQTNFNWAEAKYGGNLVEYEIPNIMGSFCKGKFAAGKNFDDEKYGLEIMKNFIKPTDYEIGAEYYFMQEIGRAHV